MQQKLIYAGGYPRKYKWGNGEKEREGREVNKGCFKERVTTVELKFLRTGYPLRNLVEGISGLSHPGREAGLFIQ